MFPKYWKRSLHMTRYNHTELCVCVRERERRILLCREFSCTIFSITFITFVYKPLL